MNGGMGEITNVYVALKGATQVLVELTSELTLEFVFAMLVMVKVDYVWGRSGSGWANVERREV